MSQTSRDLDNETYSRWKDALDQSAEQWDQMIYTANVSGKDESRFVELREACWEIIPWLAERTVRNICDNCGKPYIAIAPTWKHDCSPAGS